MIVLSCVTHVGEVRKLIGLVDGGERGALLGTDVLVIATAELDPLGQGLHTGRQTTWWV